MKLYVFICFALFSAALIIAAPQYGSPLCATPGRCFNNTAYAATPAKNYPGYYAPANTSSYGQPQHGTNYTRPNNGAPYTPAKTYNGTYYSG